MNCYTWTLAELNYEWPMSQFHICSWHRYHLTTKKIPRVIVVTVEVRVGNLLLKSKVGFFFPLIIGVFFFLASFAKLMNGLGFFFSVIFLPLYYLSNLSSSHIVQST